MESNVPVAERVAILRCAADSAVKAQLLRFWCAVGQGSLQDPSDAVSEVCEAVDLRYYADEGPGAHHAADSTTSWAISKAW
jgi:delta 1-pyrroline-5-carboxylate dehydrogenase